ncbi:MAG TPA: serine/threonine-protein kinase [Gaiellales bacterium]|nr:serine/threonine-protein kinase [Gaiellales bacterium]
MAQPAPAAPTRELTGRTVAGRYVLTGLLGRGGFGTVYAGRDLRGGGEVAVKVFSRLEGFAPRAAREARTATKLDHPNIHSCLGVEEDEDNAYLISRLVVGKRLDRSDLTDEEAVRAIAAVADALAHAHGRGVVHRDVKPSNILVGDDGAIVLTDFGIARDEDARDQTMDERVLGTLSYMAPEQAAGEQATGATDVWAAALTLYEALTGHNPYRTKSLNDLLERLSKGVKPLAHERPDLPRALSRTLQRALQRDPRRRPTAIELRDQLLAALRPEPEDEDVVSAVHHREPRELPRPDRFEQPGSSALVGASLAVMLTLYPVYPPSWTLPLAGLTALIAWRRPIAALTLGAALMLPAFWNYSQAGGLVYAALATTWIATQRPAGRRALLPLTAIPLTLLGIGPAVVLVAATARTPRRRAAEAAAGGLVAVVTGPLITHEATRHLPNSNNPLGYLAALAAAPATVLVLLSIVAFSVLLPVAWRHEGPRRVQALSLWGVGFALVTVGLPTALAGHPEALAPAAGAAALVAILPAASAVAAPRIRLGR